MQTLQPPTAKSRPVAGARGAAWPLLASTLLVGTGLVSLVDILTESVLEVPALDLPEHLEGPFVLVAPGYELALASFPDGDQVRLHPTWDPLPNLGRTYTVVLPQETDLPRLPADASIGRELSVGAWKLVEVTATAVESTRTTVSLDLRDQLGEAVVFFRDNEGSCDALRPVAVRPVELWWTELALGRTEPTTRAGAPD